MDAALAQPVTEKQRKFIFSLLRKHHFSTGYANGRFMQLGWSFSACKQRVTDVVNAMSSSDASDFISKLIAFGK